MIVPLPPVVSVLAPCHWGVEKLFARSLDSILAQAGVPFEVILVADGPLPKAMDAHIAKVMRPPHRVLRLPENSGAAGRPLNLAYAVSAGEYVTYWATDDEAKPGYLATLARFLDSRPDIDIVACAHEVHSTDRNGTTMHKSTRTGKLTRFALIRRDRWQPQQERTDHDKLFYEQLPPDCFVAHLPNVLAISNKHPLSSGTLAQRLAVHKLPPPDAEVWSLLKL